MKKQNNLKEYEAPKVEIVEVQVEKGFAASVPIEDMTVMPW